MKEKLNDDGKNAAKLVDKAICLLEMIAADEKSKKMNITDLAKELEISRSTMYRLLDTLTAHQVLLKDEESGQYNLGWELCYLGDIAKRHNMPGKMLHSFLEKLSDRFGETVSLSVLDRRLKKRGIIIDSISGTFYPLSVEVTVGESEPLHTTAYGKALLLDHTKEELVQRFGGKMLEDYTDQSITETDVLHEELQKAKECRYCSVTDEYFSGISALGCPVRDYFGQITAAVSIAMPTARMTLEKIEQISQELIKVAEEMSEALGFHKE